MKPTSFVEHRWGRGGPQAESVKGLGFVPDPLPPQIALHDLLAVLWPDLLAAERSLSQLEGAAHRLENPHLLISVFARREAILSSRIENTIASAEQLVLFDLAPSPAEGRNEVREVQNYVQALEYGLDSELPICLRLIRKLHSILLSGTERHGAAQGRFRSTQNAIGAGPSFGQAKFVPPPPEFVAPCMNDLESYINQEDATLPRLIRMGLVHYQFETVHPFLDGNGRIGRLLATLLICRHCQLSKPLVYVSGFFEQHRDAYYEKLYRVSTEGAWTEWLQFFLKGIATQAADALKRADQLLKLQADFHQRVREKRASALLPGLIDRLFTSPSITVGRAEQLLDCTAQTAGNLIKRLVEKSILVEATGRRHGRVFVAPEVLALIYS